MTTRNKKRHAQPPNQGPRRVVVKKTETVESGRYTPPKPGTYWFRPAWHKVVGVVLLIGGLTLFVSCEASLGNIHAYGGHIWFLVGLLIAAGSTWWFGLFDQPV